jgi:uncharacterized protein YjbI with pentapeptide repeats
MRRRWNTLYMGTGFREKKLWDWMSLLVVPVFIAGATVVFSLYQQRIENDRVQQSVLESYLQDMTTLLLDKWLVEPPTPPTAEGRQQPQQVSVRQVLAGRIAEANTLITIRQLDGARKGLLLQFLYNANLLSRFDCGVPTVPPTPQSRQECKLISSTINIHNADLRDTVLVNIFLYGVDLRWVNLSGANLSRNTLDFALLSFANLRGANLSDAFMRSAMLGTADLTDANLSNADLRGAHLSGTPDTYNDFWRAILGDSPFLDANLRGANLSGADLSCLDQGTVDETPWRLGLELLEGIPDPAGRWCTNLQGATGWTNEQLAQAKSLVGATLPNGRVIKTEEEWEEFKRDYR